MNNSWQNYLENLQGIHADKVRDLWIIITKYIPRIKSPQSGYISNDVFEMVWDKGENHFEIEVNSETIEWFYRNRKTRKSIGSIDFIENLPIGIDLLKLCIEPDN